jgi:hypothetical protein
MKVFTDLHICDTVLALAVTIACPWHRVHIRDGSGRWGSAAGGTGQATGEAPPARVG